MPIHQNATLLKGQHPPSPAEMAEIVNLPCHEDISTPMHMPMGTSPKIPIPYAITMSIGFHPYTNRIDVQSSVKSISTPMDLGNSLLESQHLPTRAYMAKTKDVLLHYQESTPPPTHSPKSFAVFSTTITPEFLEEPPQVSSNQFGGGGGASWINPREHTRGAMNLDTMNHNFRALEGKGIIKLVSIVEKDHLLVFQDPGEAPQHRRVDYRPIVDARHVPGRPRKVAYVLSTRAEQDNGFDTDLAMRSGQPIWEIFPPPPEINKRLTIPRASTKRGGTGENLTSSCPSRMSYITEHGGGASKLSNNDGNISGNNLTTTHFQPTDLNPSTGTRSVLMPPRMIPTPTGDISTNFAANRQTFHIRELYYLHHLRFTHGQVGPTT